jgi:hypothetical protein
MVGKDRCMFCFRCMKRKQQSVKERDEVKKGPRVMTIEGRRYRVDTPYLLPPGRAGNSPSGLSALCLESGAGWGL